MVAILSLMVVMGFMMLGEWVSTRSRAYVPSVFITALLFLVGFWTIVPKNIVPAALALPLFKLPKPFYWFIWGR